MATNVSSISGDSEQRLRVRRKEFLQLKKAKVMRRNVTMDEISDGKIYKLNDMVKADCQNCKGCSKCCHDMVDTILLNPLDVFLLSKGLDRKMEEMVEKEIELGVVNGIVLPHLKMTEEGKCCPFLDENGRCSIHSFRPDLCRLFPLGRVYENGDFGYFLQTGQCDHVRTKIKVEKWIDTPNLSEHKKFIIRWHDLIQRAEELQWDGRSEEEDFGKNLSMALLRKFYFAHYDLEKEFYPQFHEAARELEDVLYG